MPGLSGDKFLTRLRERGTDPAQRLVVLTGHIAGEGTARLLANADVLVLLEPARLEEVAQTLERRANPS